MLSFLSGVLFILGVYHWFVFFVGSHPRLARVTAITLMICGLLCGGYADGLILEVRSREPVVTIEERMIYDLTSAELKAASEHPLEMSNDKNFHLYYRTTVNGEEVLVSKSFTATAAKIIETLETSPAAHEIIISGSYPMTKWEKMWLDVRTSTQVIYEFYVPPGAILESYEAK